MKGLTTTQILALKQLPGVGDKSILKVGNIIEASNSEIDAIEDLIPYLDAAKVKMSNPHGNGKVAITADDLKDAERQAGRIAVLHQSKDIEIISYYEELFPEALRRTNDEEGKPAPPVILYCKGDLSCLNMPGLAVIGTREITPNGEKAGLFLSAEFAKKGFCIVSGLAVGCDTSGHRGALNAGGKTIAFLAHGLDTVYPPQNEDLAAEIVEKGGLLVSEYPLGMGVNRYNLVARDRLQAGLANATLVIQTGVHGGTMHAANATLNSHKPLYVVKFQDVETQNHEKTAGNEVLRKKGAAYISGSDNLDKIACEIKNTPVISDSLF